MRFIKKLAQVLYLQNTECALVTHPDEGTKAKLEHEALLVASKVANVLQNEEFGTVVITILKRK